MVLISFTNIVVDDFNYAKKNPLKRYIYFLTHMHSDHYSGISNGWNYGQIFCSEITKALLLLRFPGIQNLVQCLPIGQRNKIILVPGKSDYDINVTFFDSNHCPGSVMIMFEGYFGRILHTGDFRYHEMMIYKNPILYPPQQITKEKDGISLPVDELILDNTYCDPVFKFPDRDKAFSMICEIIDNHKNHRILICVDSIGKEELMIALAEQYETVVVVNSDRYEVLLSIGARTELFSTNRDDGWIEVIRKSERVERLKEPNTIAITATGWANITGYEMPDKQNFIIPYSLHSNFDEMHRFVRSLRPCIIEKVVLNKTGQSDGVRNVTAFSQYMVSLHFLKQRGFEFFVRQYCDLTRISDKYRMLMSNPKLIEKVQKDLGLILNQEEEISVNQLQFREKHKNVYQSKRKFQKGFKLVSPTRNDNFKITHFMQAKTRIKNIQELKHQDQQIIDESKQQIIDLITPKKMIKDDYKQINIDQNKKTDKNDQIISSLSSQRSNSPLIKSSLDDINSENINIRKADTIIQLDSEDLMISKQPCNEESIIPSYEFENLKYQKLNENLFRDKEIIKQVDKDVDVELLNLLKDFLNKKTKSQ